MAIYFCPEFLRDLAEHGDANFAARVLSKVTGANGSFEPDADDHRYQGVDGAWIRYISRQQTAYRAIFIRRGDDIFWFRAGGHSIEERLKVPNELNVAAQVGGAPDGLDLLRDHRNHRYVKSTHPRFLKEVLSSRILIPHKTVMLASPKLSTQLVSPVGLIGRLIDATVEMDGRITLVTRPPGAREHDQYLWIASRVDLLIHEKINARLFHFEVDKSKLDRELQHVRDIAIIGSSELTEKGLSLQGSDPDEELCYEISEDDLDGSMEFFLRLSDEAVDLQTYIARRQLS
ncbi:hypothetical protein QA641_09860 [Bradyrhizobium sp. CB1650]|uniref:hypothetical protein n=1 Tax=Bradyrhizobium sp. CB1650 TaxID=3039153 RepID=UPI002435935F|nr:hypothetical protein [Bradyrhizobium sp. CB1650]WGD54164.1 hypothetical protein QA641_09860 [Bradyrhizobium sp. CB1650]